jgi:hypothetical protein
MYVNCWVGRGELKSLGQKQRTQSHQGVVYCCGHVHDLIAMTFSTGGNKCRMDTNGFMVCDSKAGGNNPAGKFSYFQCRSTTPLPSPPEGVSFSMRSEITGKWCRQAPNPSAPPGQQTGTRCDLDVVAQGTCFSFTNGTMTVEPGGTQKITSPPGCPSCPVFTGDEDTPAKPEKGGWQSRWTGVL